MFNLTFMEITLERWLLCCDADQQHCCTIQFVFDMASKLGYNESGAMAAVSKRSHSETICCASVLVVNVEMCLAAWLQWFRAHCALTCPTYSKQHVRKHYGCRTYASFPIQGVRLPRRFLTRRVRAAHALHVRSAATARTLTLPITLI